MKQNTLFYGFGKEKMELLQLRYFLMVAKTGHMTSAAQKLNITQPVLSKSIRHLEDELGVPLFDRVGRRIQLNDYGKAFQKNISKVLKLLDYSVQELQDLEKEGIYEIKVQVAAMAAMSTQLIRDFAALHPNVTFRLEQNETHSIWDKEEELDLLITSSRREDILPNSVTLFSEEIALGVSVNHPLSRYDSIDLSMVQNENFIDRRPDNNFRKLTDTFCREAGLRRNISFECDSPDMVLSLIQGGLGVGFIGMRTVSIEGVKLLHIQNIKCERFIELQWPENHYRNQGVRDFISFAQKYFEKYR